MSELTTTELLSPQEIVQHIEVHSSIALHESMQDGNPRHHSDMIAESVKLIEAYTNTALINELKSVLNHGNTWEEPNEGVRYELLKRLKELEKQ